uniref:Uncharacterized protein n=1 Tax=Vitis vinifera TaxID=29760 RepID=A5C182_VITVI|nr:hypothetical protein VITISV_026963 [Vitis vinifera]
MESRTEGSNSEVTSRPEAVHSGSASTTDGIILPITGHKLNGQNFIQWAQSVRIFICEKGKEEYLTGAIVQPKEDDPGYRTWKLENSMVMSWLINSMTNDIGENFMYYGTAKEIWDATRETYSNIDNTSTIFEIKSILQDLRQEIQLLPNILISLHELVWKCPEDGLLYKKVIEKEHIYKFLLGLNKNLDEVRGRVLSIKPLPSVREVFSKIRREESRQKVMLGTQNSSKNLENSALVARGTQSNNNNHQTKKNRPWCDHCRKPGHTKETCWHLHGKPADWKPSRPQQNREGRGYTATAEKDTSGTSSNPGPFSKEQLEALQKIQENYTTWIVDSGASDHMTGNLMVFHEYTPCHNNSSVRIADGTLSRVFGTGSVIISKDITLHSVLCVPKLDCNLLSISRLTQDFNCVTKFLPHMCEFQALNSGKRIGNAENDVWGASRINNITGSRWFVTFVDDHTRVTWVLLMKKKSEVREIFENFNNIVQTQFQAKIQQNRVAERKNRHLMEVARSLMIASNVPKQLWGEAVLTTTYLINRMPSRILQFKTPCQILLAAYPSARIISSIPIKVFGCTAFVHIHKSEHNTTLSVPENNSLDVSSVTPESTTQGSKEEEIQALEKNGTWEISELPEGKRPVGCKWIFTVKHNPDGSINRFKARLVAKGFTQSYGIDYEETFAPVAKLNSIRVLLSVAVNLDWNLHQLDVKNAFLNRELEEEVYMKIPPSMETLENSGKVCKLRKSLYGLKQSPRAWFDRLTRVVKKHGFIQCQADHTLFMKHSKEGEMTLFIVYVDDIIITGDDEEEIGNLKKLLAREFEIKDLGQLRYFLGMEVGRTKEGIVVTQRKYVLDLLQETGMLGCKPVDTPMDPIGKIDKDNDNHPTDKDRYQRLVGKLIYLTHTRPDIGFAMSMVSRYMNNPTERHMKVVYRILQYLKKSPGRGLYFKKTSSREVEVFTDADWAGSLTDRRSTTGYCSYVR